MGASLRPARLRCSAVCAVREKKWESASDIPASDIAAAIERTSESYSATSARLAQVNGATPVMPNGRQPATEGHPPTFGGFDTEDVRR